MDSARIGKGQVKLSKVFHYPNKEKKEKKKVIKRNENALGTSSPLLLLLLRFRCTFLLLYLEIHMERFTDDEATDNVMI